MDQICEKMPKVELHAHLNGSISDQTCLKLVEGNEKEKTLNEDHEELIFLTSSGDCTLARCFEKFAQIHKLIKSPGILKWVTTEVIRNFVEDNVIYLELRTTPKAVHDISSKDVYIRCVLEGILESQKMFPIIVKLLISIDRKMGYDDGAENLELAIKWSKLYPDIVVGIDLSGDPTKGSTDWIVDLLVKAKSSGFQITCHLPEIVNYKEAKEFLMVSPNRVGHGLYLHPEHGGTDELWDLMKSSKIPMEICITSNIVAGIAYDVEKHHVKHFYEEKLPHVICTDDCGIFNTQLSDEYKKYLVIIENVISPNELKELCVSTIDYIFGTPEEKEKLREIIDKWWSENSDWISKINT